MSLKFNPLTGQFDYYEAGITDHNLLSGIQGGQASQYYHLKGAELSGLTTGATTSLHTHSHSLLGGAGVNTHAQIDTAIGVLAGHVLDTANPHTVTHTQVGSSTAQWNANKIVGVTVDDTNIADNFILKYNSGTGNLEYEADVSGGGGGFDPDVDEFNIGNDAVSSGASSVALGHDTDATGARSTALGYGAQSTNTGNIAIGDAANAAGLSGIAIGDATGASGAYGVATGALADASNTFTSAYGWNAQATGLWSQAFGAKAVATSNFTLAVGYDAVTTAAYGEAIGNGSEAGNFGVAVGYGAVAGASCTVVGAQTTSGSATVSTIVGRSHTAGAFAYQTILGYSCTSSQTNTIAIGNTATTSGSHAIAIGKDATASATHAIALGYNAQATTANQIVLGAPASHYSVKNCGNIYQAERAVGANITGFGQLNWRDNTGTKELWAIDSLGNATQLH